MLWCFLLKFTIFWKQILYSALHTIYFRNSVNYYFEDFKIGIYIVMECQDCQNELIKYGIK